MGLFERHTAVRALPFRARERARLPFNTFAVLFRDCYLAKFGNAERASERGSGRDADDDGDGGGGMCDVHRPPG